MFGKLLFHRELLPRPLEPEAVIEREIVCSEVLFFLKKKIRHRYVCIFNAICVSI